jgi:16S rRNA (cytidine1402-2'-O)-methyltransferase
MTGTLYLVPATLADPKRADAAALAAATLPDATRKAIAALPAFAAENAKSARAFLKACGIARPIQEIVIDEIGHAPDRARLASTLVRLKAGTDVGLLSESGCPAVADPGALLVRMAHEAGIRVVPLVGPSAILLALMASGLDGQQFAFCGYLPVKSPAREQAIRAREARSRELSETQIAIETPYRNGALFEALLAQLKPATRLAVATDLTLDTEMVTMKSVADWKRAAPPDLAKRQAVFLFLA